MKLTHNLLIQYNFIQNDWFYNLDEFTIGFLFVYENDVVDIFYKDVSIYNIPLNTLEELKFLYKLITKTELCLKRC